MVKEYGYEYNAVVDEELLLKTQWRGTEKKLWNAYCFRCGRDALKVIAREHPNTTVYLPSLCCDSIFNWNDCAVCIANICGNHHKIVCGLFRLPYNCNVVAVGFNGGIFV